MESTGKIRVNFAFGGVPGNSGNYMEAEVVGSDGETVRLFAEVSSDDYERLKFEAEDAKHAAAGDPYYTWSQFYDEFGTETENGECRLEFDMDDFDDLTYPILKAEIVGQARLAGIDPARLEFF